QLAFLLPEELLAGDSLLGGLRLALVGRLRVLEGLAPLRFARVVELAGLAEHRLCLGGDAGVADLLVERLLEGLDACLALAPELLGEPGHEVDVALRALDLWVHGRELALADE